MPAFAAFAAEECKRFTEKLAASVELGGFLPGRYQSLSEQGMREREREDGLS